jgi:hypothetical protein
MLESKAGGPTFETFIANERARSATFGGKTVGK